MNQARGRAAAGACAPALRKGAWGPAGVGGGGVGLGGEVRAVGGLELRLAEAAKMGFSCAIIPESNRARLTDAPPLAVRGVATVEAALEACLQG